MIRHIVFDMGQVLVNFNIGLFTDRLRLSEADAVRRFNKLGVDGNNLSGLIKGIELIDKEAQKSKIRAAKYGLNSNTIQNADFFSYISTAKEKFDVVIGNPPFIRYQNFPEEHRELALKMMHELKLHPNKLINIWVPFLVISASKLKPSGKLAMVIPAELFQVMQYK